MEHIFLVAALDPGDYVAFTFFIGTISMMAATVFFFLERNSVAEKWRTSLLVSGLITFIAAVHYFYMRDVWIETGTSPTEFRYIDWILTVPLMCVEFYLILRAVGAKISLLWKMIAYSLVMLIFGYLGEAVYQSQSVFMAILSTLGYIGILYEIWIGSAKQLANSSNDPILKKAFTALAWFVLVGWAIYPIGYMAGTEGGWLSNTILNGNMDIIYNIGDAINKIGFGLVIYTLAIQATKQEAISV